MVAGPCLDEVLALLGLSHGSQQLRSARSARSRPEGAACPSAVLSRPSWPQQPLLCCAERLVPGERQLLPPALGALVPALWYPPGFSVGKRQRGLSKAKDLLL